MNKQQANNFIQTKPLNQFTYDEWLELVQPWYRAVGLFSDKEIARVMTLLAKGACRQADIGRYIKASRPTIGNLLKNYLPQRGLVLQEGLLFSLNEQGVLNYYKSLATGEKLQIREKHEQQRANFNTPDWLRELLTDHPYQQVHELVDLIMAGVTKEQWTELAHEFNSSEQMVTFIRGFLLIMILTKNEKLINLDE